MSINTTLSERSLGVQLTAPGASDAPKEFVGANRPCAVKVVVASINTSVTVRAELSNSSTFASGVEFIGTETITANGTYYIPIPFALAQYVRGNFTAEAGGTDATVDFSIVEYAV